MKHPVARTVVLLVAVGLLAFSAPSRAAGDAVAVIVNKSNPINALTMDQLKKILLAQESKWPSGSRIMVWLTSPGQRDRAGTLKMICGMSETDFTLHYVHAFKGGGDPPSIVASSAQMRQSIAGVVNGVGFMLASQLDDSVKVIAIDGIMPGAPSYKLTLK
jgi:ABC-type phosphate transport system substrate-binding protein